MTAYHDQDCIGAAISDEDLALSMDSPTPGVVRPGSLAPHVTAILEGLGEDPTRDGLLRTPDRVEKSLAFLTKGYADNLTEIVNGALFESDADDIVLVRDIEVFSMCEHHMLPFWGRVHVAYIPDGQVIGLSKLPRIVDMFARRLQLQERLTGQVAQAVERVLKPRGVAVISECAHMCMMMRGVQKNDAITVCRSLRGAFRTDSVLRRELTDLLSAGTRV